MFFSRISPSFVSQRMSENGHRIHPEQTKDWADAQPDSVGARMVCRFVYQSIRIYISGHCRHEGKQ